ncbi:copper chaperone PCu(A)C [Streptomyces sp. NPDC057245]|uniref:copper chaperone PCu(A)C n=1 Tax=Streptomyces TaxID=1883 RepID=UPI001C1E76D7|nr:copper chaperone PCu(A)C [Streptomyces sp. A108]MBU6529709.1 copper chaperone PCu(A)C [Streptomyces sp. A108]
MRRFTNPLSSLPALDRRRLKDLAPAVLVPFAACSVALAGLTTWVGAGRAGSPAEIRVDVGKVLMPSDGVPETAAFFRITNEGGSPDTLVRVTARGVPGAVTLSRHRMTPGNAAYRSLTDSVSVAAGTRLEMSPGGVDLTVPVPPGEWSPGDLVPFTLEFRRSGRIETTAAVVQPGSVTLP